ncbi:MAG: NlpC/P60 family protein [Lachnospiraceae bacterium]|nr:NlpC/P60 family protein [Lachnospiraceae bacterium]
MRISRRELCVIILAVALAAGFSVSASSITSIQKQKEQNEQALSEIQSEISSLESQKSELSSEVSSLSDELTEMILNISVLESDLDDKEVEIEEAQEDYEEAKATEEKHYESMKLRIQYLYEAGQESYVEMLLTSDSIAELINKVDYAEELQEYDRRLLEEYQEAKETVVALQEQLEEEKAELLEMEEQLEEDKASLEMLIAEKESEIEDFDSQLSAAQTKASEYQQKIKEQAAQIKKLQQEAQKASTSTSSSSSSSTSSSSSSSSSSSASVSGGTGLGASIASYGLKFVGNPYVYGGNSLTNGTDCSGFVYLVHANFGISVPRSSSALASGGTAVSDADKQPGDVICYYGHVGIYIGNNQLVHASTESTGIKVSNMYYRTIRCIRRYW